MTVSSSTNRASYSGNGSLATFAYGFKVFDQDDLTVILRASDGTETVQTITTDYTVTGVGDVGGGNVVFGTAPASGVTIVIIREQPLTQGLDLVPNDPFPAQSLEESLDKLTFIDQRLSESIDRALTFSVGDFVTDATLPFKEQRVGKVLAFNETTGDPEAGPTIADAQSIANVSADIALLADIEDGTLATNAITNVNGVRTDIATLGPIASNITTVSGVSSNVTTVAGISGNVTTVSGISSDVTTLAGISSDVTTAANNDANITTVSGISGNVTTVAGISGNVTSVAGISSNVTSVAAIDSDVTTVAGISGNVSTVAGISSDVATVAADGTDIGIVAGISSNITTVAGDSADIQSLGPLSSEIGLLGVASVITDMSILGTADVVNDMNVLGTSANVTAMGLLGTSAVVTDMSILGTADVVNDMNVLGTASTVTAMNLLGTSAVVTDMSILGTADVVNDMNVLGTTANVTAMNILGTSGNVTAMSTVSGNIADVTAVAADATDIGTVATDLSGSDNIGAVAGSISNVNNVGGSIASVNTVASNLASVNNFGETYRIAASDPTTSLDEGDLYFDTTNNVMKVYDGSAWVAAYASLSGALAVANNLSDLGNVGTARTNLGLVIGTDVQAFDANNTADANLNSFVAAVTLPTSDGSTGQFLKTDGAGTVSFASIPTINTLNDVGNVTITSASTGEFLKWSGSAWVNATVEAFNTQTHTTTATSQVSIAEYAHATYDGVKAVITADDGTNRSITEILITHNGTTAIATEYGQLNTSTALATFDVDISGSNIRILATPAATTSTGFTVKAITL